MLITQIKDDFSVIPTLNRDVLEIGIYARVL